MKGIVVAILLLSVLSHTQSQGLLDLITSPLRAIFGGGGGGGNQQGNIRNSAPLLARIVRNPDGSGNNLNNPNFGKVKSDFIRLTRPAYADGVGKMLERGGSPRRISNIVGAIYPGEEIINNRLGLNMLFLLFGQFIDHDIGFVIPSFTEKALIKVPKGDANFDPNGLGNQNIQFSRAKFHLKDGARNFENQMTHWLDGSVLYGSDPVVTNALRQKTGGKMKMTNNMLTRDANGAFLAGQLRTSENVGFTSIVTIFYRQHNRQCDIIMRNNRNLNDEQIFQMARNKIVGFMQKITYKQFLPALLGIQAYNRFIGPYRGYDSTVNPSLSLEFTSAAFRIGHPLLHDDMDLVNFDNRRIKSLKLSQMFVSFQTLKKPQQVDFILNGLLRQPCKERNNQVVSGVRNMFVQFPGIVQDLFSLNVQRGRDEGVPDYNSVRRQLGIKPINDFSQLTRNSETVQRLREAYNDDVDNFDLWVGIISQQPLKGSNLGYMGAMIVGDTFKRLRDGDRFYYEGAYPPEDIAQIQATNLGIIIARNTGIKNFPQAFIENPFMSNFL